MRTTQQRGFTLVELMTVVALTTVLLGAMVGLANQAQRGVARAGTLARELDGFRNALALLGADLRSAQRVDTRETDTVRIATARDERRWNLRDGVLTRTADGRVTEVATAVRELVLEPDGRLWRVTLRVGHGTPLRTAILPRTEVEG